MVATLSGVMLSIGLLGAASGATTATPPRQPPPAPEMKELDYFRGEWSCTGRMPQTPSGPAHSYQATIRSEPILDGHWYSVEYTQKATPQTPAFAAHVTWGWVPQKKEFTRTVVDNGGGFDHATSKGWQGEKITWTGECNCTGEMTPFRHILTKKNDAQMTSLIEVKSKDGWKPFMEDTCQKTGKVTQR